MKIAIFFGENLPDKKYDYYIGTEYGALFLNKIGITPDLAIGDFDTVRQEDIIAKDFEVYPRIKDKTDLDLCIQKALQLTNENNIEIYGKEYGRIDHLLYQINELYNYPKIKMHYNNCIAICVDKDYDFEYKSRYITIILRNADVETFGLRWELNGHYKDNYQSLSNEFIAHNAKIKIRKGSVIIIYSN